MRSGLRVNVVGALALLALVSALAVPKSPIADAAMQGDAQAVRALLKQGADVNAAQGDGMTALHWAAERGDAEIAKLLIGAKANLEAGTRIGRYTPLHLASKGARADMATLLLEAGANVNARTTNTGVTPLHLAAAAAHAEAIVAALLQHGAEVNARESSAGQTPLMFAAAYNRAPAIAELLKRGADPALLTSAEDVLHHYAVDQEADKRLKETLAAFREKDGGGPDWEPSPEQIQAAVRAQREVLAAANQIEAYDPAMPGSGEAGRPGYSRELPIREILVGRWGGLTALLHAAREGHVDAALALLDGGADVDQVSGGDQTSPLLMAALNGHFDLALRLIERGADPGRAASTDGATPLFAVLQTYWAPKSRYPQPRAQDFQKTEYLDVLKALLEAGANPNVQLKTHLWYWEYGRTRLGMDVKGATPFWRAAFAQDIEAMRLLASYGADPNIPTSLPPVGMREARQQDGRIAEDSGLPPSPPDSPGSYPIHMAAGGGYLGLGAYSIRSVPDAYMETLKYLVEEHGADVNLADYWGYTPLHYAASRGDNEMIRYLVSKGAHVTAVTRLGQSTADMARGGRGGYFQRVPFPETQALLESLGSKLLCLNVHFNGTGDYCAGANAPDLPTGAAPSQTQLQVAPPRPPRD